MRRLLDYEIEKIEDLAEGCKTPCELEPCCYLSCHKPFSKELVEVFKKVYAFATRNGNSWWEISRNDYGYVLCDKTFTGVLHNIFWVSEYGGVINQSCAIYEADRHILRVWESDNIEIYIEEWERLREDLKELVHNYLD